MSPRHPREDLQDVAALHSLASMSTSTHSSPSSRGSYSNDNTPGTKLTDLSPRGSHSDEKAVTDTAGRVSHPPSFALQGTVTTIGSDVQRSIVSVSNVYDPFAIDTEPSKVDDNHVGVRLSPTAATFMPLRPTAARFSGGSLASLWLQPMPSNTAVGYLSATSVPDVDAEQSRSDLSQNSVSTDFRQVLSPIGPPHHFGSPEGGICEVSSPTEAGFSTTGPTTRYLKISQVLKTATIEELNIAFNVCFPNYHIG